MVTEITSLWGAKLPERGWIDAQTGIAGVRRATRWSAMGLANSAALKLAGIDPRPPIRWEEKSSGMRKAGPPALEGHGDGCGLQDHSAAGRAAHSMPRFSVAFKKRSRMVLLRSMT